MAKRKSSALFGLLHLRKLLKIGPVKVAITGSGIGASVGTPGARAGVDAQGRPYVALSVLGFTKRLYGSKLRLSETVTKK